jgi:hypothetical protein
MHYALVMTVLAFKVSVGFTGSAISQKRLSALRPFPVMRTAELTRRNYWGSGSRALSRSISA